MIDALRKWCAKVGQTLTTSQMEDLTIRVLRYRGGGSTIDGLHTLNTTKIDDVDWQLMGADNSCARINNPTIRDFMDGRWFAISKHSDLAKRSFGNSHSTSDDGGKTYYTETAFLGIPDAQYQAAVEEVVWHHLRVLKLRAQNVPEPERVKIMTEERKNKPWLKGE